MYSFPLQQTEQEEVDDAVARAKAKRASMVKKALRYFEDKSNRSMSEDNLFTRRKNLAVHLGKDLWIYGQNTQIVKYTVGEGGTVCWIGVKVHEICF